MYGEDSPMPPSLKKPDTHQKGMFGLTYYMYQVPTTFFFITESKSSFKTSDSIKNDESKTDQNSKDSCTSSVSSNHSSKNSKNSSTTSSTANEVSTSLGSSSAITVDSSFSSGICTPLYSQKISNYINLEPQKLSVLVFVTFSRPQFSS